MPRCTNPGGRPRKYASDAERQKAYRERWAIINVRCEQRTKETLRVMQEALGDTVSEADIVSAAIKFYALNFDWKSGNLFGKRLPTIADVNYQAKREREDANKAFLEGNDDDNA